MDKNKTQKKISKRYAIIAILITLILSIDIVFTGFIKFGYNTIRCGGIPVVIHPPSFGVGPTSYWMPGKYNPGGAGAVYVCSEQEAKDKGATEILYKILSNKRHEPK